MTGGAHDTLRDELAEALADYDQNEYPTASYGYQADALLPVVLRYADAQVAAERERLDAIRAVLAAIDSDGGCIWAAVRIGRILDGEQP